MLSGADSQNYKLGNAIPCVFICNVLRGKLIINAPVNATYSGNLKTDTIFDTSELVGYNPSDDLNITISVDTESTGIVHIVSILQLNYMASDDLQIVINYITAE